MPTLLGRLVTLRHYVDANLYHDLITGRTGILHLANKNAIGRYFKGRQLWRQLHMDQSSLLPTSVRFYPLISNALCYLGVPFCKNTYMFGDTK